MVRKLKVEELEERIAPAVIAAGNSLSFTDANGTFADGILVVEGSMGVFFEQLV